MPTIRYGTCSWSEKSWVGPFYPPGTAAGDMLAHYATQFDTVEADTTYYRTPSPALVQRWTNETPPGFVMSCKLARTCFLGEDARELDAARVLSVEEFAEPARAFVAATEPLGARRGSILLQCPRFAPEIFRDLSGFLARLDPFLAALPTGPRWVIEVRNRDWLHAELLAVLRRHRAALALVDLRGMPHPAEVLQRLDLLTTDSFYARLIGDRSAVERRTKTFDHLVIEQTSRLQRWVPMLRALAARVDGFVYASKQYAGYAPDTARELQRLVEGAASR